MARRKAAKKPKGINPSNRLLALRKRFRKKGKLIMYHHTLIPDVPMKDKRYREVRGLVRDHHGRKRKKLAGT